MDRVDPDRIELIDRRACVHHLFLEARRPFASSPRDPSRRAAPKRRARRPRGRGLLNKLGPVCSIQTLHTRTHVSLHPGACARRRAAFRGRPTAGLHRFLNEIDRASGQRGRARAGTDQRAPCPPMCASRGRWFDMILLVCVCVCPCDAHHPPTPYTTPPRPSPPTAKNPHTATRR